MPFNLLFKKIVVNKATATEIYMNQPLLLGGRVYSEFVSLFHTAAFPCFSQSYDLWQKLDFFTTIYISA